MIPLTLVLVAALAGAAIFLPNPGSPKLSYNPTPHDVDEAKQILSQLGFDVSTDAKFGGALRVFQAGHSLKPSGNLDQPTCDALLLAGLSGEPAKVPDAAKAAVP